MPGDPLGDARATHSPHPLDDGPPDLLRPGELASGPPTAGDFAALVRDVRALMNTWRDSIMPMLLRQDAAAESLRKELSGTLSQVHNQGREIDALRKMVTDLAVAHDAQRHMFTERVSRVELAIVEITKLLKERERGQTTPRKAKRKPARRRAA